MGSAWTSGAEPAWDEPRSRARDGQRRAHRPGLVALAMVGVLLLLTGGGYVGVTWSRAEQACVQEVTDRGDVETPSAVDVAWSWNPPGIRCTWDGGARTSLWWGMADR